MSTTDNYPGPAPVSTSNPSIIRLGPIDNLPWAIFSALSDHPMQRDTAVHSIKLLGSGVLHDHPMVKHDEVSIVIVGAPASIRQRFSEDPIATLHEFAAYKENGHSRDHLSKRGEWTAPETCYAMVYAAADQKSADLSFRAVDLPTATKTAINYLQSSFRKAGITPTSDFLRRCTGLGTALNLAISVLCGGLRYAKPKFLAQDNRELPQNLRDAEALLPYLRAVYWFKTPIQILDRLNPSQKILPVDPGSIAAYLSILRRDPQTAQSSSTRSSARPGCRTTTTWTLSSCCTISRSTLIVAQPRQHPRNAGYRHVPARLNAYQRWSEGTHFRPRGYSESNQREDSSQSSIPN